MPQCLCCTNTTGLYCAPVLTNNFLMIRRSTQVQCRSKHCHGVHGMRYHAVLQCLCCTNTMKQPSGYVMHPAACRSTSFHMPPHKVLHMLGLTASPAPRRIPPRLTASPAPHCIPLLPCLHVPPTESTAGIPQQKSNRYHIWCSTQEPKPAVVRPAAGAP
jgi:hypothetical protein